MSASKWHIITRAAHPSAVGREGRTVALHSAIVWQSTPGVFNWEVYKTSDGSYVGSGVVNDIGTAKRAANAELERLERGNEQDDAR